MEKDLGLQRRNQIFSLLLVLFASIIGWGISAFVDSLIPFWLLLGSSVTFSIEKWLKYYTRKNVIGKIYRLTVNLGFLAGIGLLIWSGGLFTQKFMENPLTASIVLILEIAVFIWLYKVVSDNQSSQPSMKLTIVFLICLFLIFSFAGVQPMAGYKDNAIVRVTTFFVESFIN